jgi:hypothetical protein
MVRLGYVILLYKKPELFDRLLRAIDDPRDCYAVHVDRRAPAAVHRRVGEIIAGRPNVRLVPSRRVMWGGWSLTRATLDGFQTLLQMGAWDFALNLSGQDYPIKMRNELVAYLADQRSRNFIETFGLEDRPKLRMDRLECYHVETPRRVYRLPVRRKLPGGMTPYWGSFWVAIDRAFAEYVCRDPAVRPVERFFRHTLLGDESFFQMVAMNSARFRETVVPRNLRMIEWGPGPDGTGIAAHPNVFTLTDLPRLLASDCFFARKFDDDVDGGVLDALDERLVAKA